MDYGLPGSSVHGVSQARKNTGVGCHFLLQGNLPNPEIELTSPTLAGRFFTTEAPGKPTNTIQFSSVAQSCPTLCDPMNLTIT